MNSDDVSIQKPAPGNPRKRQRETNTAFALFFMLAGLFGTLLAIHYLQPERPPSSPPGASSP